METKKRKIKPGQVAKLIELPKETVKELGRLAKDKRMPVKPYMEVVLIDHAKTGK